MPTERGQGTLRATRRVLILGLVFFSLGSTTSANPFAGSLFGGSQLRNRAATPQPQSIHPAVCRIVAPGKGSISFGSGTLIDANEKYGLVITNWHVVNESTGQLWVMFPDGFQSPGVVQKIDRDWDLAAIAIFRPNAQPVKVAGAAPQPGELLTIAGYGSGDYRAVSGRCTQYVAPGLRFPYEMVELAATARQGDSGGPIFNDRGELAGVLFGAGGGRTSGSYSGRVQWFLSSLQRPAGASDSPATAIAQSQARHAITQTLPQPSQQVAQTTQHDRSTVVGLKSMPADPPPQIVEQPVRVAARDASSVETVTTAQFGSVKQASNAPAANSDSGIAAKPAWPKDRVAQASPVVSQQFSAALPQPKETPKPPVASVQQVSLAEMLGPTPGDQLKTILAAVGLLALLIKTLSWLTTPPPKPKRAARAKAA